MEWDAIVVGGGAAGLSAGVVLARTGIRVVLVENRSPRNAPAAHMHGFLSRDGMNPAALLATGREEMVRYGGRILAATAVRAERLGTEEFRVTLDEGSELTAPALLLATGARDEMPELPGATELWGELVHHCPHCHGREVAGQRIAVVGGANPTMSAHQALLMRRYSDRVTFYPNGGELTEAQRAECAAVGVTVADTSVVGIARGSHAPLELSLDGGGVINHDCAFIAPVSAPRDAAFANLGLARAPHGAWVEVGASGRTSVEGVWAAGNLSNPRAQVITAAGEGSAAAIDMTGALLVRDVARAVAGEPARWFSADLAQEPASEHLH